MQRNIKYDSSKVLKLLETLADEDPELGFALYTLLTKIMLVENPKKCVLALDSFADLAFNLEPITD